MSVRSIPESASRQDWARLAAQAVNQLIRDMDSLSLDKLGNYANDAAAAAGGVPVGGYYRNGSALMIRVA